MRRPWCAGRAPYHGMYFDWVELTSARPAHRNDVGELWFFLAKFFAEMRWGNATDVVRGSRTLPRHVLRLGRAP